MLRSAPVVRFSAFAVPCNAFTGLAPAGGADIRGAFSPESLSTGPCTLADRTLSDSCDPDPMSALPNTPTIVPPDPFPARDPAASGDLMVGPFGRAGRVKGIPSFAHDTPQRLLPIPDGVARNSVDLLVAGFASFNFGTFDEVRA